MDSGNLPPLTSDPVAPPKTPMPLPDAPMDEQKNLSLMPDQLVALGLDGIEPGKTYTIQLKAMGGDGGGDGGGAPGDGTPGGQNFEVLSADADDAGMPAEVSGGDGDLPPPPMDGPDDSGDEKVLGFKRDKKPPRVGLPDTKKMRDL